MDHRCQSLRWTGGRPRLFIDTRASGPRRVPVVVVIERQGKRAVVRSGRVRLERSEPNGPGCGTWWNTDTTVAELRVPAGIR